MPTGNPGRPRKPRGGYVLQLHALAYDVADARRALDAGIRSALAAGVPYRAIAEATGISTGTLVRRFRAFSTGRRWPTT